MAHAVPLGGWINGDPVKVVGAVGQWVRTEAGVALGWTPILAGN
jgi:hypothetical protein